MEISSKYKIVYKWQKGLKNHSSVICVKTNQVVMNDLTHAQCEAYIEFAESD